MAIHPRITGGRRQGPLPLPPKRALLAAMTFAAAVSVLCLLSLTNTLSFTDTLAFLGFTPRDVDKREGNRKYLYWGTRIDCPGKHCGSCAGLGHQESSLRCALEEALFLDR